MRVIERLNITDAILTASNVPETDYAAWSSTTAYAVGARAILAATHKVYEAIAASTGKQPDANIGTYWIEVSATNRWKAFDCRIGDPVTKAGLISYTFLLPSTITAVAFFGLNADPVRVKITDQLGAIVYDVTKRVTDISEVVEWWSYFFAEVRSDTETVFSGLPGYPGYTMLVTVNSGGTTEVGQIVLGYDHDLGDILVGSDIGLTDYSRKERDTFGNPIIVERAFAQKASYQFRLPTDDARRVQKLIAKLRATPAVYCGNEVGHGNTVFGFHTDFKVTLSNAVISFANLEVEGLV